MSQRQPNRPRSWEVTDGPQRAPARAMLRAVGFSEEDFGRSQIAVASSWNEVTPCNYHLDKLAALAHEGVADQSRGHRGLRGARHARGAVRRAGRHRRLRQVRAGDANGDGPTEPG